MSVIIRRLTIGTRHMMRIVSRQVVMAGAAAVLTVLITSCSSSSTSGTGSNNSASTAGSSSAATSAPTSSNSTPVAAGDGCQYVTVDVVSAAVGATVTAKPLEPAPPFNAPSCLYESTTVPLRQITVAVLTAQDFSAVPGQSAQTYYNAAKSALTNVTPLPGLGDEAFSAGSAGSAIYVRKGANLVRITAGVGGTSDTAATASRTVAAAVVAHL